MKSRSLGTLLLALSVLAACGKKPEQAAPTTVPVAELDNAKKENAALKDNLGQKTQLLNQVQEQLDALAKTGEVVSEAKQQLEGGVKTREQSQVLFENIEKAKKLLADRANKIKALETRLGGSEAQLKQVMDLMTHLMIERSKEIEALEGQIAQLRGEKKAVEEERDAEKQAKEDEIAKRQEAETQLDTAYYAVGTEDELKTRGILAVKKGGFLGAKKRVSVAPITSFDPFQKVSIEKTQQIPLGKGVKKWEVASGHDISKTNLEKVGDESFLDIHEPKTFWKDKVLVIVVTK
jgi:hypothetical protein